MDSELVDDIDTWPETGPLALVSVSLELAYGSVRTRDKAREISDAYFANSREYPELEEGDSDAVGEVLELLDIGDFVSAVQVPTGTST